MTTTGSRRNRISALLVAAALLAAGCGSDSGDDATASGGDGGGPATSTVGAPEDEGEPQPGGSVTIVHASNPSSLDPVTGGSGSDHQSLYPLYDRLIMFDPNTLEPQPGLAESWQFPDPSTLVLTLREGVTFHDGTPFDAEAVKFNLDRATEWDDSTVKQDLSMIESVEVLAPNQVQVNLNREDSSLLLILGDRPGMMASPTAVEAMGQDFARNPVGSGPFEFVEWLPNDRMVLEKNESYWQEGLPYLDGITFRYIADQQTAINALTAGEADLYIGVTASDVATLEQVPDLDMTIHPSLWVEDCYFNFSKEPFSKKEVRQAFNYAIDREALNEAYLFGLAEPAQQPYPTGYWAHQDELDDAWPYDPDKARELLEQAGYPDGVSIHGVATSSSGQARKNEIIQAQLAEVGIDMTFEVMEVGAATATFFEGLGHDVYCVAWTGRPDPSQTALSIFGSPSFYNAGDYEAPGMAEALRAAGASSDLEERAQAFHEVVRITQDEALWSPNLFVPNVNAFHSHVNGFTPNLYKVDVSFLWVEQ